MLPLRSVAALGPGAAAALSPAAAAALLPQAVRMMDPQTRACLNPIEMSEGTRHAWLTLSGVQERAMEVAREDAMAMSAADVADTDPAAGQTLVYA